MLIGTYNEILMNNVIAHSKQVPLFNSLIWKH